jgi:hypothetical protein
MSRAGDWFATSKYSPLQHGSPELTAAGPQGRSSLDCTWTLESPMPTAILKTRSAEATATRCRFSLRKSRRRPVEDGLQDEPATARCMNRQLTVGSASFRRRRSPDSIAILAVRPYRLPLRGMRAADIDTLETTDAAAQNKQKQN